MPQSVNDLALPRLDIPEPAIACHPGTIVRVAELRRWLQELPSADLVRMARSVARQLSLLVRYPETPGRYAELLRCFQPVAQRLHEQVWQQLVQIREKGQPSETQEQSQLAVPEELAFGYMRLINEAIAMQRSPHPRHLYHAMLLLGRLLLVDLIHYRPLALDRWRRIQQIYAISEFYSLTGVNVESEMRQAHEPPNLHGLFFQLLILLLCDPNRLPLGPLNAMIRVIGAQADRLHFETPHTPGYRAIPLDLSGDGSPLASARGTHFDASHGTRFLAVQGFLEAVRRDLSDDAMETVAVEWIEHTLRTLLSQQDAREQRRSPRRRRALPYHLRFGLVPVHVRLGQMVRRAMLPPDEADMIDIDEEQNRAMPDQPPLQCRMLNHSDTGAAFSLADLRGVQLAVGDLVLFECEPTTEGERNMGFPAHIRRIVQHAPNRVELGVEKLPGKLIPVRIGGPLLSRKHNDALLHRDLDSDRHRLYAPHGTFRKGRELELQGPYAQYRLNMQKVEEVNLHAELILMSAPAVQA